MIDVQKEIVDRVEECIENLSDYHRLKMSPALKESINSSSANMKKISEAKGINILNNDCLMHIIQYLPIVDRVRIERVCKRWLLVSQDSWRDFKNLDFENDCWGFCKPERSAKVNRRVLKKILNRCGKYLISIEFSELNDRLGPNILKNVARLCPNIEDLDASVLEVSPWSLRVLSENCSKLVSFAVGDCTDECDNELSLVFEKNVDLSSLCISSNFKVTGKCLNKLNGQSIQNIIFENCPSIALDNFHVVKDFRNLKQLVLVHFHDSNNKAMDYIGSCHSSLDYLTLSLCPFYTNSLQQIGQLRNLKTLDLSANISVNDELLTLIAANCKLLKLVDVGYCNSVTDTGLAKIVSLPNLEILNIEKLNNITDQVFTAMPNLTHLNCSYCINMGDAGLAKLIETSENIESLNLCNCKSISNELLEAAIRATKKRRNKLVLRMYLSNTNVRMSEASERSPFLRVIPAIFVTCVN